MDYSRLVVCECPRCGAPAHIEANSEYSIPWRPSFVNFHCSACAHNPSWSMGAGCSSFIAYDPSSGLEPYFGFKLLLQESVRGKNLVAFNLAHATDILHYTRELNRPSPENSKWAMVSRLPAWAKSAKNRPAISKALKRIIRKAGALGPNKSLNSTSAAAPSLSDAAKRGAG